MVAPWASQHGDHASLLRVRPETPLLPRVFLGRTMLAGGRLSPRTGSTFRLFGHLGAPLYWVAAADHPSLGGKA